MTGRKSIVKIVRAIGVVCGFGLLLMMAACGTASSSKDTGSFYVGTSKVPWGMALNSDYSLLYVANSVENTVEIFDTATMNSLLTIPVLCTPRAITFNSDYSKLYVSHDNQNKCTNSQISYAQRNEGWASVISIADKKVVTEISLSTTSGYVQNARDIQYYHDPTKSVADFSSDAVFFTGYQAESQAGSMEIINASTDAASAMYVPDSESPIPFRVRLDTSKGLMYILDAYTQVISIKKLTDPQSNSFSNYTYNGQTTGYCAGTTNKKNNCACTYNSECNSGLCNTSALIPYCKEASGVGEEMVTRLILADSSYNIKVRGICDPSTKLCTDAITNSSDYGYMKCINPWDILPMDDGTMYVTCNGGTDEDEKDDEQYLFRVLIDDDGLASTNSSVVSPTSDLVCAQPTDLATDPDQNYVFVACFRDRYLAIFDGHTGEYLGKKDLPGPPVDIIASRNYVFVSTSSANKIMRFSINPLRN